MVKVEYSSNNSGGSWWLTDKDWKHLEKAGWIVEWKKERWFGALAKRASIEVEDPVDAVKSFEKVTGQEASEIGCTCCGPPHEFSWEDEKGNHVWVAGDEILAYLFPKACSHRDALEYINKQNEA